jgi:hypothetical protein
MKRSIRLLSILPFLFNEVRSNYLRDRTNPRAKDTANGIADAGWTAQNDEEDRGTISHESSFSVRRILPEHRETFEFHECSANIVAFESVVFIEFNNDLSNLTDTERQSLEQGFLSTYNELNQNYCDLPFYRSITNVTLEWPPRRRLKQTKEAKEDPFTIVLDGFNATDQYSNPDDDQYIEDYQIIGEDGVLMTEKPRPRYFDIARFFVSVVCHNCPSNTSLFSLNETIYKPSSIESNVAKGRVTGSESEADTDTPTEICACRTTKEFNAPFRAPTAAEFQASFNQTVGSLHVNGVLQSLDEVEDLVEVDVVDCSKKKKTFSSSIVADLEGSVELMTPDERRALEQG